MKKKHYNTFLSVLIIIAFVYILRRNNLIEILVTIKPTDLFFVVLSVLFSVIAMSHRFRVLLSIFKQNIKMNECFGLTVCLRMFNYYMPARGGVVPIAYYLKRKYNFGYLSNVSLAGGSQLLIFIIICFFGIIASLLFLFIKGVFLKELIIFFTVSFFMLVAIFLYFPRIVERFGRIIKYEKGKRFITGISESFSCFHSEGKKILDFTASQFFVFLTMSLRLYFIFNAINVELDFISVFIMLLISSISMLFTVTPANLGIKEAVFVFAANLLKIPAETSFLVAVIDRSVEMLLIFPLGLIYSRRLLRKI